MAPQLLLTYDFPPIGGGIARWMAELAKRYPPGSLVVSTGQHPDAAEVDASFPNRVDRLPLPARRLRSLQGLLFWSRRAAVLTRQSGIEFIWCGNMKPASYPAKWTMERLGTPFGVLLHGGDLLILQHQVHQSVLKRRTARALLSSAAVLVANSQWTRERCLTLLSELEIEPAEGPGAGRSTRRRSRLLPSRGGHRPRRGNATVSGKAAGCSPWRACRVTRASTPPSGPSPCCGTGIPPSDTPWWDRARSWARWRRRLASSESATGYGSSPTSPTATCPRSTTAPRCISACRA